MATILFDATRLLRRGGRRSPTGIDRVVLAYARWLSDRPGVNFVPVWTWGGRVIRITDKRFEAIIRSAMNGRTQDGVAPHHPQWPSLVRALGTEHGAEPGLRPPISRPGEYPLTSQRIDIGLRFLGSLSPMTLPTRGGAIYVNVGHSGLDRPELLARLERAGISSIVFIHDLIPIIYPEFCGPGAASRHRYRMDSTLKHAAMIITNSATTAQDVRDYAATNVMRLPPIVIAPLGLEPNFVDPSSVPFAALPYFVSVGTIEPRKNLVMLLKIWRRLADRLGPSTPRLVLVGRRGWENESVLDHLQRSPPVVQYVHEIADLGDEELARLICGARALLAPSAAEGFDLPVVEALALSTPVIASDIPAHRELAHGALLLDATDGPAWLREIAAAAARPRRRGAPFQAPTWDDHFDIVRRAMAQQEILPDPGGASREADLPRMRQG